MKAVESGELAKEEYRRSVLQLIDFGFQFISIDTLSLVATVRDERSATLPIEFRKLAGRLGGPEADLASSLGVALHVVRLTWRDSNLHPILRQAIVGTLLENLCRGHKIEEIGTIIQQFAQLARSVFREISDPKLRNSLIEYLHDWLQGHFIQLPTSLVF
jgi:hypothetical protein